MHFIICSSAKKFQTHHSCDCKTKKLTVSSLKGVAYLFCRHYVPVWFNTTISLEVTKMLFLFWTDQPQPAYRRGVSWTWERRVVYTCVSHWAWKSGLGSSLLRSVGCCYCCCIGDHCPWRHATMRLFYTRNKFLIYVLELLLYGSSDSVVRVPF